MLSYFFGLTLILTAREYKYEVTAAQITKAKLVDANRFVGRETNGLIALAVSKDREFIACCSETGDISIHNKNRIAATFNVDVIKHDFVTSLAFDPEHSGRLFYTTAQGFFVCEWKNKSEPRELISGRFSREPVVDEFINRLAISPNGRHMALIDANQRVLVIKVDTDRKKAKVEATSQLPLDLRFNEKFSIKRGALCFSPDSTLLAQTTKDEISLYDLKGRKELRRLKGHTDVVGSLVFINNEILLSGSWDGTCRTWNIRTGNSDFIKPNSMPEAVPLVASTSDGKRFVCAFDDDIKVFSFPGQKEISHIKGPKSGFTGIAFLHNSQHLVTSGESAQLQFWDILAEKETKDFRCP